MLTVTALLATSSPWHQPDTTHLLGGLTGCDGSLKPGALAKTEHNCMLKQNFQYELCVDATAEWQRYVQGAAIRTQTLHLSSRTRGT